MLMVQEAAIHKSLSPVMQHLKLVDYGSMTVLDNHKSSTVLEAQEPWKISRLMVEVSPDNLNRGSLYLPLFYD
jgi:hypothetical protein